MQLNGNSIKIVTFAHSILFNVYSDVNNEQTISQIKTKLVNEYSKIYEEQFALLWKEMTIQGKFDMVKQLKENRLSLETLIMSDNYYLTNIDIWMLAKAYNIPIVLFLPMGLNHDIKFVNVHNDQSDTAFFVKSVAHRKKNEQGKVHLIVVNNETRPSLSVFDEKWKEQINSPLSLIEYHKLSKTMVKK